MLEVALVRRASGRALDRLHRRASTQADSLPKLAGQVAAPASLSLNGVHIDHIGIEVQCRGFPCGRGPSTGRAGGC
jgi:hypothetical protein